MISQNNRLGVFYPPDTTESGRTTGLALLKFTGHEAVNSLFEFKVDCLSSTPDIDFDALLGRNASIRLETIDRDHPERYFDGLLTEAQWLGPHEGGHGYLLTLRPWLWVLGLRENQRIFHNKTAPEIIAEIFADHGFAHVSDLQHSYPQMEYTVQFQESDLDFVQRLMSLFGISYHFTYALHEHTLVLFDEVDALPRVPGTSRPYRQTSRQYRDRGEHLHDWTSGRRMTTGRVTMTDYNFATPRTAMKTEAESGARYEKGDVESFVYPGRYPDRGAGRTLSELRQKQAAMTDGLHEVQGDCASLLAGMRLEVAGHPDPAIDGERFVALSCRHTYTSEGYRSGDGDPAEEDSYEGRYTLRQIDAPVVPPAARVAPRVPGPQTAVVVGEGEIDCDEYGRIIVRFHWDRDGAHSMRCRVAQLWAGKGWGGLAVPRIGMEVVVEFIDGDPTRPLVVGCVYNADNMPPFDVAEGGKTMGMKSNSTPGGGGYNELAFDDTQGAEEMRLHAQYDLNAEILHDEAWKVGNDETRHVGNDRKTAIGNDDTLEVGQTLTVTAGSKITLKVGMSSITMDASSITLKSPTVEIKATQQFTTSSGAISEHKAAALMDIKGALVKINS